MFNIFLKETFKVWKHDKGYWFTSADINNFTYIRFKDSSSTAALKCLKIYINFVKLVFKSNNIIYKICFISNVV